ncbi:hypothetical protein IAU60_005602 [Kwoniella sp. DSM 27419]
MDQLRQAQEQINSLLSSIETFVQDSAENATYQAPIIDWHHPDSYRQTGIVGLRKFHSTVETERDYINALVASSVPPKEVATNVPHLLALWQEVERAAWPIVCISQILECGEYGQAKVDVVARGGEEWIKVNTMKESRLMAEFREQDSYINSDYDPESPSESGSSTGTNSLSPKQPALTNSAIAQAASLMEAANAYSRIPGFPPPRIKYVFHRLVEDPEGGYEDPRVKQTFQAIRDLGVDLVLASDQSPIPRRVKKVPLRPTKKVLLDLSVVVALCCDSTHQPLPTSEAELEARFRSLQVDPRGEVELAPHIPVTKDLRDQLEWEMRHPLIQEMLDRLTPLVQPGHEDEIELWATDEVRGRLPAIADIIGGEDEKRRARALFDGGDFWQGSRWQGRQGILRNMVVKVLPPDIDGSVAEADSAYQNYTPFRRGFMSICRSMLEIVNLQNSTASLPPQSEAVKTSPVKAKKKHGKSRRSRQPPLGITMASRLPSAHTLRTFLVGFENGWTVLTNNRGAVGKVIREMRIGEGLGYGEGHEGENGEISVWVVNPSSLAEWRRKEVETKNQEIEAYLADPDRNAGDREWLDEVPNALIGIKVADGSTVA